MNTVYIVNGEPNESIVLKCFNCGGEEWHPKDELPPLDINKKCRECGVINIYKIPRSGDSIDVSKLDRYTRFVPPSETNIVLSEPHK